VNIISFDLEYNPSEKRINEFGFCTGDGKSGRGKSIQQLFPMLDSADILLGHNIIHHDLKVLLTQFGYAPRSNLYIDTLFLSSLLFANKPYHKLTKDYISRLSFDEIYFPDFDSELALKKLLPDFQAKWDSLDEHMKATYFHLLQYESGFRGFFHLMEYRPSHNLHQAFDAIDKTRFCIAQDLIRYTAEYPLELAYALAIIQTSDSESILPAWITHTYPQIAVILHELRFKNCGNKECNHCHEKLSSVSGLRRYFGFPAFRKFSNEEQIPLQQQIVDTAMNGKSLLAILPTGGGKSLCYQVPALMAHEQKRSLTVVISPLQSLMKDQVDNLQRRNIFTAFTINGLIDPISRAEAVNTVENGRASILYISPESLRSKSIFRILLKRNIERIVVDEAHCFSSWGHDFRPDYFYIAGFIRKLQEAQPWSRKIPVSCFTATAKPEVIKDIANYFQNRLQLELTQLTTKSTRTNLHYNVVAAKEDEKLDRLLRLLDEIEGPTIIYASRTKRCHQLVDELKKHQKEALIYHGQLDSDFKKKQQDLFMNGEADIIVATSAFGMGVDKSNITNVIHYEISNSLENYVQEAGRAGRDQSIQAKCHVLFDEEDLQKHFALLNSTKLNKKEISQIWKALREFKRKKFSKSALEIAEKAGWDTEIRDLETRVKTAIASLEETGFIEREENATRVFAKSVLVKNFDEARRIIEQHSGLTNEKELEVPIRIMQYLISRQETQTDTIALHLGLSLEVVGTWINRFKDWKLVGDMIELEAFVSMVKSKNSSKNRLETYAEIEQKLIEYFVNAKGDKLKIYLKELHDELHLEHQSASSFQSIQRLVNFWELNRKIKKQVIGSDHYWLEIDFKDQKQERLQQIQKRNILAGLVLEMIVGLAEKPEEAESKEQIKVVFTTTRVQEQLQRKGHKEVSTSDIEEAIYFLILMEVISIEGGLMVFYNPMKITRKQKTNRQYTNQDFELLQKFYDHKTEQVHIVGEYARKMLRSHLEALHFVDDYFQMDYPRFLDKYFKGVKGKIKRPVTEKKFREIIGNLSQEQEKVVQDNRSSRILVGAGPGSGKTRILVHKVAAILLMEDVKPDQFLMLTFSRPAAEEMKQRLRSLIGPSVYGIQIKTFHSYAFDLVGKKGDLDRSQNVIKEAVQQLRDESQYIPKVGKKEVIVVDEYQDIDEDQFHLLQEIGRIAENARIIVVGDDDQNIYEFRGSSIKYMKDFAADRSCREYFLTRNYRSKNNIVAFANELLKGFPDERIKADKELLPYDQQNGQLEIHKFPSNAKPFHALVEKLLEKNRTDRTAILTRTNEESLLIHSMLLERGIHANLILSTSGYQVKDILEIEAFTHWVTKVAEKGTGRIPKEIWIDQVRKLKDRFKNSASLSQVLDVIEKFTFGRKHIFKTEWLEYIFEIRPEDLVENDIGSIWLSTMHKAKGKEFDSVYLYLDNLPFQKPADYRLLYVAITRAKQNLFAFTNDYALKPLLGKADEWIEHHHTHDPPNRITLQMGLSDMHLGMLKRDFIQAAIKEVLAGYDLEVFAERQKIILNGHELSYSKRFSEEVLGHWQEKGYQLTQAVVYQVVMWYDKEEEREYRVPLPRLILST
jgi:ATP-dependent DNA helicase RecQ